MNSDHTPAPNYDLIVIGTGSAGSTVASQCRQAGWSVAIIDHRPFGGTCALRGCDPKKILLAGAEAIDGVQRMGAHNVVTPGTRMSWPDLHRFKQAFTDPIPAKREHAFIENGVDTFHGVARFVGRDRLSVGDHTLSARHIVIATGAEPVRLPIKGAEHLATSTDFLDRAELPQRVVFVGGGLVGFEFAHVAARAGAAVTLIDRGARPLSGFDPDLVDVLVERTRALGIDVRLAHSVRAIRRVDAGFEIETDGPDGSTTFEADLAVNSGGRAPAIAALDLDAADIAHADGKLKLDDTMRSVSNPAVYAAGDVTGSPLALTPVAAREGRFVAGQLLGRPVHAPDYTNMPRAVFTVPPLARVGLLESEAREQGLDFAAGHDTVPGWFTARRLNESAYGYKVLVENGSGRILGAHLIGPDAAEVINVFALAIQHGITADALQKTPFCYPTVASDIEYMLP